MKRLLDIRTQEELGRLDGISNVNPSSFLFFEHTNENKDIKRAYEIMQNQYVFRKKDKISFQQVIQDLSKILTSLNKNKSWYLYKMKNR